MRLNINPNYSRIRALRKKKPSMGAYGGIQQAKLASYPYRGLSADQFASVKKTMISNAIKAKQQATPNWTPAQVDKIKHTLIVNAIKAKNTP